MKIRRERIVVLAAAVVGLVTVAIFLPISSWLLALVAWIRNAGPIGFVLYLAAYVACTVALLPGSILTLGAGFAYGPILGTLLVSPASVLGATLAFLLGRSILRDWVGRRVSGNPRFRAIDEAIGENGLKIVLLLRLSPIFPFNLLNYALGLTRVRLRDYVLGSLVGMLPGTVLYVYLGSLVTSAAELASGGSHQPEPWGRVFFWGGLAATVAVVVLVTRVARKALDRALPPARPEATRATSDLDSGEPGSTRDS